MNETVRDALQALRAQFQERSRDHYRDGYLESGSTWDAAADELEAFLTVNFPEEDENKNLDPKPWVAWGVRYARSLGTTYFEPRPMYSQNREDYPA